LKQAADGSETETYYYNALGQRYMVVSYDGSWDTRTFVFNGSSIIRELDGATTNIEYGIAGGFGGGIGAIAYQEASNDTITFYSYNHKGDVAALLGENESVVALYEYDAFGNVLTDATDVSNNFTFSTREFSEVSGLGHWPMREYDAFAGRWTKVDPAGIVDGFNKYVYAKNRPIIFIDPTGGISLTPDPTQPPADYPWYLPWPPPPLPEPKPKPESKPATFVTCPRNKCSRWKYTIKISASAGAKGAGIIVAGVLEADPRCCMDKSQYGYGFIGGGIGVGAKYSGGFSSKGGQWFSTKCIGWLDHDGLGRVTSFPIQPLPPYTYGGMYLNMPQAYLLYKGWSWGANLSLATTVGYWSIGSGS